MTKRVFIIRDNTIRANAIRAVQEAPQGHAVVISEPTRSLCQNARLWASLGDIATQVEWYGRKLDSESWKHIFSSSLQKMDVVPNLEGTGFVALGLSTSRMSKRELSDLLELLYAFGNERGVKWTDPMQAAD